MMEPSGPIQATVSFLVFIHSQQVWSGVVLEELPDTGIRPRQRPPGFRVCALGRLPAGSVQQGRRLHYQALLSQRVGGPGESGAATVGDEQRGY